MILNFPIPNNLKNTVLEFEDQIEKYKSEIDDFRKENKELNNMITDLQIEIGAKIKKIDDLEHEVKEAQKLQQQAPPKQDALFMGKYDQEKICGEIKELLSENEDLKTYATELKNELEYGKQRENKLMYFLFLLQQKDYPVFDVFETYIKDLNTQRFSTELDEDYKNIYIEQMRKLKELGLLEREWYKSERKQWRKKLGDSQTNDSFL